MENELHREELDKKLLAHSLDAAKIQRRAAEAETNAAELKSQLYASIGIMDTCPSGDSSAVLISAMKRASTTPCVCAAVQVCRP